MNKDILFYFHPDVSGYDFGANHPFRGDRFEKFMHELEGRFRSTFERFEIRKPESASDELLELVHTKSYMKRVDALERRRGFLSLDTQVLPGSASAAKLIAGSSVAVAKAAMNGGKAIGFGGLHHAGPDYGEGFCIFNDVAVSAGAMLKEGLRRIMIIDTDAHQANGTMDIFYEDPRVLLVSLHQDPRTLYPGRGFISEIGKGPGKGFTVNVPMPVLSTGELYDMAMNEIVIPLIDSFAPELLIRNGGSDPLYTDILTNLGLDLESLSKLIRTVAAQAETKSIPLADLFLSGYGPYVTEGWLAIIRGITNEPMELDIPEDRLNISTEWKKSNLRRMRETLDELKSILKPFWKTLA